MKKVAFIVALAFAGLTLQACQGTGASEQKADEKQNKQTQVGEEPQSDQGKKDDGSKAAIQLNKETFKKKVVDYENSDTWDFQGDKPCVVDFYADWCAPCRITSPILEELAKEYKDQINVYKVDVDKHKELAAAFGVRGIPTFLYCPVEGKPTKSSGIAGSRSETKQMFRDNIKKYLLKE